MLLPGRDEVPTGTEGAGPADVSTGVAEVPVGTMGTAVVPVGVASVAVMTVVPVMTASVLQAPSCTVMVTAKDQFLKE